MATDLQSPPEPTVTSLVKGILEDAQRLFNQQITLIRTEIREDFRKTKDAALAMAWGVGILAVGGLLLCLMLPLLLEWATQPTLPLWACFGIVGGILALLGAILVYAGVRKFESFNPLPDQSVQGLKENVTWSTTTNPK